jgi:hypothetical protein
MAGVSISFFVVFNGSQRQTSRNRSLPLWRQGIEAEGLRFDSI